MRGCRELTSLLYLIVAFTLATKNYNHFVSTEVASVDAVSQIDDIFKGHSVASDVFSLSRTPPVAGLCVALVCLVVRSLTGPEQTAAVAYTILIWVWLEKCSIAAEASLWSDIMGCLWPWLLLMSVLQLSGLMLGHELLHQRKLPRFWSCLVLAQNGYLAYIWEHVYHHAHAGSHRDLASTTRHTSIYSFLLYRYPTHIRSALRYYPMALGLTSAVGIGYIALIAMLFSTRTALILTATTLLHWMVVDSFTYLSHYAVIDLTDSDIAWDSYLPSVLCPFFYGIHMHTEHHYGPSSLAGTLTPIKGRGNLRYPYTLPWAITMAFIPPLWYYMTDPIIDRAIALQGTSQGPPID